MPTGGRLGVETVKKIKLGDDLEIFTTSVPEAEYIYREIFEEDCYLRHGGKLRADAVVLDVGGNIGMFSIYMRQRFPDATILSFEPVDPIRELMEKNLALNDVQVEIRPYGLSSEAREVTFTYFPHLPGNSTMYPRKLTRSLLKQMRLGLFVMEERGWVGGIFNIPLLGPFLFRRVAKYYWKPRKVISEVRTLSSVIDEEGLQRLDLVKIDVERSELDVLQGIEERHWDRIGRVVLEVSMLGEEVPRDRLDTISQLLEKQGFRVLVHQDDRLKEWQETIETKMGVDGRSDYTVYGWRED